MKKKILIIFFVIFICLFILKIYQFLFFNRVLDAIQNFKNQKNRVYDVEIIDSNEKYNKLIIYKKDSIIKNVLYKDNIGEFCAIKNISAGEEYAYNTIKRIKYENKKDLNIEDNIINLPSVITYCITSKNGIINGVLKIQYIIPVNYEGKKCYKISTNSEIVIIDKDTYLPIHSEMKMAKSQPDYEKIEYNYKFEVGSVTDEDISVPDFSDYTIE